MNILEFLFNNADISGDFVMVSVDKIAKECDVNEIDKLVENRLVIVKNCQTGRKFYCLTKKGEKLYLGNKQNGSHTI